MHSAKFFNAFVSNLLRAFADPVNVTWKISCASTLILIKSLGGADVPTCFYFCLYSSVVLLSLEQSIKSLNHLPCILCLQRESGTIYLNLEELFHLAICLKVSRHIVPLYH